MDWDQRCKAPAELGKLFQVPCKLLFEATREELCLFFPRLRVRLQLNPQRGTTEDPVPKCHWDATRFHVLHVKLPEKSNAQSVYTLI